MRVDIRDRLLLQSRAPRMASSLHPSRASSSHLTVVILGLVPRIWRRPPENNRTSGKTDGPADPRDRPEDDDGEGAARGTTKIRTAEHSAARHCRRGVKNRSGGLRAGSAFRKCVWCACQRTCTGWRCTRAARNSPDDVRIRQATASLSTRSWLTHLPLFRALRPGCPGRGPDRPRELLWALVPARTLLAHANMSATGPDRCPALARLRKPGSGTRPVAGMRGPSLRKRAASGTALTIASPVGPHRRLCAKPGAFPPAWLETFAIHPAAGARKVWHGFGRWG